MKDSLTLTPNTSAWIRQHQLGAGTFGSVAKVINHETQQITAVKYIRPNKNYEEDGEIPSTAVREVHILKELNHPNIIRLLYVDFNPDDDNILLYLECMVIDLKRYINALNHEESYTYQLLSGIEYIHSRRILHRDLKPHNILIDYAGILKLADFGLARYYHTTDRTLTHEVATLRYRAPEVLLNAPTYSMAIDVWSFGCIFAEMCTKKALFFGESEIEQLYKIFQLLGTPTVELWSELSECLYYQTLFPKWTENKLGFEMPKLNMTDSQINFLKVILIYSPKRRPMANQLLKHPYFTYPMCVEKEIRPNATVIDRAIREQQRKMINA
ncbi:unnamed protein product [Didymodactylos carnosus]|uniref:Protein kinase domain-containing protein n=1 Tax=Didymodactylos carnosus TaxID=1234261 RepID=A0A815WUY4_9BILA|nr:unnamed protein product [Didymodactylos carnosus]CAF1552378.1 unnamed protein product [Didymodactylos carnosus]CAF3702517.1 unnamed protein product [Didymodactylos carnosus]CAF4413427.1 unnamed protein product [Didymodactylos carnosus]